MELTVIFNRLLAFICVGLSIALVLALRKITRLTKSEEMNWNWYKTEWWKNIILTEQLNTITSANIKLSEEVSRVSELNKMLMARKANVCKAAILCIILYCMYKKMMETLLMETILVVCVILPAIVSIIKIRTMQQLTDQQDIIHALNAEVKRWSDEKFFWYNSYVFWLKQCEAEQDKIAKLTELINHPQKLMDEIEALHSIKEGKYHACIYWDNLANEKQSKHAQLKKEYEELIKKVADLNKPNQCEKKETGDLKNDEETSEEDMTSEEEEDEYIQYVVNYDRY